LYAPFPPPFPPKYNVLFFPAPFRECQATSKHKRLPPAARAESVFTRPFLSASRLFRFQHFFAAPSPTGQVRTDDQLTKRRLARCLFSSYDVWPFPLSDLPCASIFLPARCRCPFWTRAPQAFRMSRSRGFIPPCNFWRRIDPSMPPAFLVAKALLFGDSSNLLCDSYWFFHIFFFLEFFTRRSPIRPPFPLSPPCRIPPRRPTLGMVRTNIL